jgi:hypothetical protein
MIAKKKKKVKSRRKRFIVYGRFLSSTGTQIEQAHCDARTMATALRKAIPILFRRSEVRWKHHYHVNFSCQAAEEVKHG